MAADGGESIGNTKPLFTPTLWSLIAPRQRPPRAPGSHPSASPEHHLGTLAGSQPGGPRRGSARCHSQRRRQLACSRPSPSPAGILSLFYHCWYCSGTIVPAMSSAPGLHTALESVFHEAERRRLYRIRPLPHYPLVAGTAPNFWAALD